MKRLSMVTLLLIALSTGAVAHQGSIGMYIDQSATDCDASFTPFLGFDIVIMYFRSDAGPNGITAAEFKVVVPFAQIVISSFTPSPAASVAIGDINTGLAVSFVGCTGAGNDYTLIGTINVLPFDTNPLQMRVMTADDAYGEPQAPRASTCEEPTRPLVALLGGWFTAPDGTCFVGTEEKTWGAIKEMYRD